MKNKINITEKESQIFKGDARIACGMEGTFILSAPATPRDSTNEKGDARRLQVGRGSLVTAWTRKPCRRTRRSCCAPCGGPGAEWLPPAPGRSCSAESGRRPRDPEAAAGWPSRPGTRTSGLRPCRAMVGYKENWILNSCMWCKTSIYNKLLNVLGCVI